MFHKNPTLCNFLMNVAALHYASFISNIRGRPILYSVLRKSLSFCIDDAAENLPKKTVFIYGIHYALYENFIGIKTNESQVFSTCLPVINQIF